MKVTSASPCVFITDQGASYPARTGPGLQPAPTRKHKTKPSVVAIPAPKCTSAPTKPAPTRRQLEPTALEGDVKIGVGDKSAGYTGGRGGGGVGRARSCFQIFRPRRRARRAAQILRCCQYRIHQIHQRPFPEEDRRGRWYPEQSACTGRPSSRNAGKT